MKNILSILFASFLLIGNVSAQTDAEKYVDENDPEATAIFQKVRAKYEGYESFKVDITTIIEVPEHPKSEEQGTLVLSGEKYNLDLPSHTYLSNGENLWVHYKDKKMVQINSIEEDEASLMTPNDLFKIYEREDFVYVLTNEYFDKKTTVQQIELKPTDRGTEYSKIRVNINKKTSEIKSIKVFFKDGIRYQIKVSNLTPDVGASTAFSFDKKAFPNVKVEDLRID